jgi:hypothetical protein
MRRIGRMPASCRGSATRSTRRPRGSPRLPPDSGWRSRLTRVVPSTSPAVCYGPLVPERLGVDMVAAGAAQANSPLIDKVLGVLRVAHIDAQHSPHRRRVTSVSPNG